MNLDEFGREHKSAHKRWKKIYYTNINQNEFFCYVTKVLLNNKGMQDFRAYFISKFEEAKYSKI